MWFEWIPHVPVAAELIVTLGGAAVIVYGAYKNVYKPVKKFLKKWDNIGDSLGGRDAILDPDTGEELKPATPPMAHRVSMLEDAFATMVHTQKDIANIHLEMEKRKTEGLMIVDEWTRWREKHEEEASRREERFAEWEAWRSEQTLMLEAMKNAHDIPHK